MIFDSQSVNSLIFLHKNQKCAKVSTLAEKTQVTGGILKSGRLGQPAGRDGFM